MPEDTPVTNNINAGAPTTTQELPPPSVDVNIDFMKTDQCAKAFEWIAIGFINTIILLFAYRLLAVQTLLIMQLFWCCFAPLSWCFIAKGMTDLKSLSPSLNKIRALTYLILLLVIGVVVLKLLIYQKVLGDSGKLIKMLNWLHLLELCALFMLPVFLIRTLLSTITKISIITKNAIVHKATKIIKGLFYIYFPASVCAALILCRISQVDGGQPKGHANPTGGLIIVVCVIAMLVLTTALIAGASQLLFKTAKMCREFSPQGVCCKSSGHPA